MMVVLAGEVVVEDDAGAMLVAGVGCARGGGHTYCRGRTYGSACIVCFVCKVHLCIHGSRQCSREVEYWLWPNLFPLTQVIIIKNIITYITCIVYMALYIVVLYIHILIFIS